MICPNCGAELPEKAKFCMACGAKVTAGPPAQDITQPQTVSPHITRGDDGVYRWRYDLHLLKNPTIFILVWKILFFIILGIAAVSMTVDAFGWKDYFPEMFLRGLKMWGIFILGMTVLVVLGYLLYAAIMGWKYCVLFEMDEKGINHKQIPVQAKKAKKIAAATVIAGLATGKVSTVGVGLNASRTEMYSAFENTRKVKAFPRRGLIKVNTRFTHNQVYAQKEDFEFVKDYILSHCPNLK